MPVWAVKIKINAHNKIVMKQTATSSSQIQELVLKDLAIHSLWAGSIQESYWLKLMFQRTPFTIAGQSAFGCTCNTTTKFTQTSNRSGLLWIWKMILQGKVYNSIFHKRISKILSQWHLLFRIMLRNKQFDISKKMFGKKWSLNNQMAK